MIKHIVCWKLKSEAEGMNADQNAEKLIRMLEDLSTKIPSLRHIEAGKNFNAASSAYDVALYSVFEDEKGLAEYQSHPEHKKVAEFVNKIIESRVVVDYDKT
jgi:hypothetical protein